MQYPQRSKRSQLLSRCFHTIQIQTNLATADLKEVCGTAIARIEKNLEKVALNQALVKTAWKSPLHNERYLPRFFRSFHLRQKSAYSQQMLANRRLVEKPVLEKD
jgi:hypothetical protein